MLDLAIRGGTIIDGSGQPRYQGDLGIVDGTIVEVGSVEGPARRVIDAEGHVVCPGFVDVHTHFDVQGFWDPTLSPSALHGVTTVFAGNCGFSVAPINSASTEYVMRMLARVEGIPVETLAEGVPWSWKSTSDYLGALDGLLAINAGFLVGHSTLRRMVMGESASERAANYAELAALRTALRESLEAGAIGFSSSTARTHSDHEGRPVPSRSATNEEIIELAAVCGEFPGTSIEFAPTAKEPFTPEIVELMTGMSVWSQRPVNWNTISVTSENLNECLEKLQASDYAKARGGKIVGLETGSTNTFRLSFYHAFLLDAFPGWGPVMALPVKERCQALADRSTRKRLDMLAQDGNPLRQYAAWASCVVTETFTPSTSRYTGRKVGDIANEEKKDPFDALLDIVCADDLRTTFERVAEPETEADWDARRRVWRDDRSVIGGSDAGAHLDMIASYSYPTRLLQRAVRESQVIGLEEAINLLTQKPARLYGLRNRGTIANGYAADVVVLDDATVGYAAPISRFDLPGSAMRLYCEAIGIRSVIVNGQEVVDEGVFTEARSGKVLRAGKHTSTPSLG